jgi:hypothetical protein
MSPRVYRALPFLLLCLTVLSSTALAQNALVANLQTVLNDFHAANPSAPGVVVRVASPSRGLEWTAAVGLAQQLVQTVAAESR